MIRAALLITAALLTIAPATASYDGAMAQCQKFAADNETSPEPCTCIAEAIGDNQSLLDEQQQVATLDDFAASSEDFRAAVNPCLPPDQQAN